MIDFIIAASCTAVVMHMILQSAWFQKWRLLCKLRKCNVSKIAHVGRDGHAYGYDTLPKLVDYDCKQPVIWFGYYPALAGRIFKK